MNEVIKKVIAAEAEAKRLVQAAKTEAERIMSEAKKRALELRSAARQQNQIEVEQILASATADADKEKQARLAAVAADIEKRMVLDEPAKRQAIAAVLKCVSG
jgi:vacuolar-type H+-ATPase subunit H